MLGPVERRWSSNARETSRIEALTESEGRPTLDRAVAATRSNLFKLPVITALGLASAVVVVRVLSPDDFALFALAVALRMTVQLLTDLGTGAAAARLFGELEQASNGEQARRLYGRLAAIRIGVVGLFAAALLAFSGFFSNLFDLEAGERAFLTFLGLLAAAEAIGTLGFYVLTGTFRQDAANGAQLLYSVLQPTLVVAAAAMGFGLAGILAAVLIASYIRSGMLTVRSIAAVWLIPRGRVPERPLARVYTRVATSTLVGKLAAWAHSRQVVTIIAMSAVGRPAVAVFAVAYDFVHQVLMAISGLFYNLLLPGFVSRAGDRKAEARLLFRSTRVLAIAVLPAAAALIALYPSLSAILFGEAYDGSVKYALVIVPALTIELILSGPCTAFMTADDSLVGRYRNIKLATLVVGVVYFVLVEQTLLGAVVVMMATRVASSVGLYVSIRRRTGLTLAVGWLVRFGILWSAIALVGLAVSMGTPGHVADLPTVVAVVIVLGFAGVRVSGLVTVQDLTLVNRVVPEVAPLTDRMASWIRARPV
jgi:O-antigen/teichoic acid export membrane protein